MPKRDATRSLSLTSQESYSAVIIADMVAEVRTEPPPPDAPAPPPTNGTAHKSLPHHTNPAFDPAHLLLDSSSSSSPAVVDVEMVEAQQQRNGASDITRGVILNATQFGHVDKLMPDPLKMDPLRNGVAAAPEALAPKDLHQMSLPRKIAFGFSFLPSLMFVLCFAVILPCKEPSPCRRDLWTHTVPYAAATSDLVFSEGGVFYVSRTSVSSVVRQDQDTGLVTWAESLKGPAHFLQCDRLDSNETTSCLVMQDAGQLMLYNATNGHLQWTRNLDQDSPAVSSPVVLPDCNGDGVAEVGTAVTKGQVKVLMNGAILVTVNVSGCDSVPANLTPWKRANSTDLLLTCRHGDQEKLMKLPRSRWCLSNKKAASKEAVLTLESRGVGVLKRPLLLPTEDGLVLWVQDDVIMFEVDGQQRWKVSSTPHSADNRFLLYGKFNETDTQVALFSGSLQDSLKVSTLSSADGAVVWSKTEPNSEVSDVALVHGKEKDFALVSLRKAKLSLASEALDTMEAVSTTIVSILATEEVALNASLGSRMSEAIGFVDFEDKSTSLVEERDVPYAEGGMYRSTVNVVQSDDKDAETISVFILRNPTNAAKESILQLRRIDIANWDISLSKESHCKWRQ